MKTALITGSSKRLGRSMALHLAKKDYFVWIHYFQDHQNAMATADYIRRQGGAAEILQADLTKEEAVLEMFAECSQKRKSLDLLVNNAAVIQSKRITETKFSEWNEIFGINLRAPWFCSICAAELMKSMSDGVIINIADSGATKNWIKNAAYGISKNALINLTQVLAKSLAPNIRVNSISPGLILPSDDMKPDQWNYLVRKSLLKRDGKIDDLLRALDFILDSPYLTGADIVVDGGYRLGS